MFEIATGETKWKWCIFEDCCKNIVKKMGWNGKLRTKILFLFLLRKKKKNMGPMLALLEYTNRSYESNPCWWEIAHKG